ncbi:GAF domain-containing protein [Candidatus Pelagisphaera phototrophica]|uniref:GAF domain-containing protein n=1 Tax=Candidatus Pelagisphaera phototrophica TaxID=2684113 RepID=UPI0019FC5471|nr:GAF domain-containing protein [Candidatus Pelagisphaera phototrophica]QXD32906.1 GAF domain-containing protein [Candidatus Pelagisphaera phototrophica]
MLDDSNNSPIEDPNLLLALYRISQIGSSAFNIRDAFKRIIEEIQILFQPKSASISLISPNSGLLEIEYALGYPTDTKDLSLHIGKGITGRVAFNGVATISNDVEQDSRYVKLIDGIRSKMAVPLFSEGQIAGVIDVDSDKVANFTARDLKRLEAVADESITSLQSVWKQRQLITQSDQLKALISVGQKVVSNLELQGLWESITEAALDLTKSRMVTLQLYDETKEQVTMQAIKPPYQEFLSKVETLRLEESMNAAAIRTKRQVEFPNITTPDYLDLKDAPQRDDVVSCLSTPMIYEDRVIGIINIFTRTRHRFPNDEKRLLQAFASLSAAAAQNANLYARVFNSEDLLRKSERLTTLGLLSAEIAHEIRNPLTVIKLLFGSLGLQYDEADPRNKDTQIIIEKINQLEEIVSKVLSFGKAPEDLHTVWSIDELIQDTLLLVRLKMQQHRIVLNHKKTNAPIMVNASKGQLQQVFLNLIINAAEAMPDGGTLTIYSIVEESPEEERIAVYFTDTGSGIPENIQEKIFESFLTDKPEGTGLGLSIVKRIMRTHHGDISVANSSSLGTTLRIEMPLAQ